MSAQRHQKAAQKLDAKFPARDFHRLFSPPADDACVFHLNASLPLRLWCLLTPDAPPFVFGNPQLMPLAAPARTSTSNSRSRFLLQTLGFKLLLGKTKSLLVSAFTFYFLVFFFYVTIIHHCWGCVLAVD